MDPPPARRSKRARTTAPEDVASVQVTSSSTEVPSDVHAELQEEQPMEVAVGDRVAATADRERHVPEDPSDGAHGPAVLANTSSHRALVYAHRCLLTATNAFVLPVCLRSLRVALQSFGGAAFADEAAS